MTPKRMAAFFTMSSLNWNGSRVFAVAPAAMVLACCLHCAHD
jgi:hypothetical protein